MSFLLLMCMIGLMSWVTGGLLRRGVRLRAAMRFGAGGAFLFTGVDHFLNDETRYLPMMPAFFGDGALPLIWLTGAAELLGAVGLLLPAAFYRRLGLPDLRYWAGVGLGLMLSLVVIANVNVAVTGSGVDGLPFGQWYYWIRPLLQPLIILWVFYAAGVIPLRKR